MLTPTRLGVRATLPILGARRPVRRTGTPPLPEFPIISRGVPVTASYDNGGNIAKEKAIDGDYGSYWRSVFSPNGGTAQWLTLDLRGVPSGDKADCWCIWKNPTAPQQQPGATLGGDGASTFNAVPRNYTLQAHAAGSSPAPTDPGWVDLATVTDNRLSQRIHTGLDLHAYNWFRFYCTASSGVPSATEDIMLQLELRTTKHGTADSWYVYSDSIGMESFGGIRPDNALWDVGPLENLIEALTGRAAPVLIDGATGGWQATTGDTNKAAYFGADPCHNVIMAFGSNDANQAGIDLNEAGPPSGIDSNLAQARKAAFASMIDYALGQGKAVVIPTIPWGNLSTWSAPNVQILNTIIDQVLAEYAGQPVYTGPDIYTLSHDHPELLRDALHFTYSTDPGGTYNEISGYGNHHLVWANWLRDHRY